MSGLVKRTLVHSLIVLAFVALAVQCSSETPVAKRTPVPEGRWVLRVKYVDDIWVYTKPDRCDVGRQAIETRNADAIPDGMRRQVVCEYEVN